MKIGHTTTTITMENEEEREDMQALMLVAHTALKENPGLASRANVDTDGERGRLANVALDLHERI